MTKKKNSRLLIFCQTTNPLNIAALILLKYSVRGLYFPKV